MTVEVLLPGRMLSLSLGSNLDQLLGSGLVIYLELKTTSITWAAPFAKHNPNPNTVPRPLSSPRSDTLPRSIHVKHTFDVARSEKPCDTLTACFKYSKISPQSAENSGRTSLVAGTALGLTADRDLSFPQWLFNVYQSP